jgi:hypothetical protein
MPAGEDQMKLAEILRIIEGKVISKSVDLQQEVQMGSGADLMSDVLRLLRKALC